MLQKNKRNLMVKMLSLVMLFSAGAGVATAVNFYGDQVKVMASAADFAETLGLEDRAWGAAEDEYYFGVMNNDAYLNTASAVSGVWNSGSNTASLKPANNGVDIMQYIYVNGESARAASDTNKATNAYKGSSGWLANGANYAPVFVETTDDSGIVIKMLKAYAGDTVTITFKEGFSVVDSSNTTLTLTKDVSFKYENGTLSKVEDEVAEPDKVAMDDKIAISTWGNPETEPDITWIHMELNGFTVAGGDWHNASDSKITANNGVDPLDYTYINGKSAREIYNSNNSALTVITATGWVEAYVLKVSTDYLAFGNFTIQLKAGFTLVGADGVVYELKNDTEVYGWTNGDFGVWVAPEEPEVPSEPEDSTVALDDKVVISSWGAAETGITWIEGELSFAPAAVDWDKATAAQIATNNNVNPCDYVLINGKTATELNAQASGTAKVRCYNWGENSYHFAIKVSTAYAAAGTFTVQYKAGLTLTGADGTLYVLQNDTAVYGWTNGNFGVWVAPEEPEVPAEPEIVDMDDKIIISTWGVNADPGYGWMHVELKDFTVAGGDWHTADASKIAANNGVDPLEYVYINGKSARAHYAADNTSLKVITATGWTEAFAVKVNVDYLAFGTFTIQLKAGFTLVGADGNIYVLQNDTELYGWKKGDFGVVHEYTLSFEGLNDTLTLFDGNTLGELPAVPTVDGKLGVWTIDGKYVDENTVYEYGSNKTAVPVYYTATDASETLKIDDWGVITGANYTTIVIQNNGKGLLSDKLNCWNDNGPANALGNMGCDLTDYIYINGRSVRAIVTDNKNGITSFPSNGSDDFALNLGKVWAPVTVETSSYEGGTIYVKVLTEYLEKGTFTVTVKAGFKLVNANEVIVLTKDVDLAYAITYSGYAELATKALPNTTVTMPTYIPTFDENETHRYEFDGWYVTDVKTGEVSDVKWDFENGKVTGALTLTPMFNAIEKDKYTVSFDAGNGTEIVTATVYDGSYVKADQIPEEPTKATEGDKVYTFWYWSIDGETEYDFATPVTGDVTLVAVYTTETLYTVTMGDASVKVLAGEKVEKPADPTKESTAEFDFTFDGWYNGETKWDFENDVVNSNITLEAKYIETKRVYTITFNVTGNDAVSFDAVQVEYGTSYDLSNLLEGIDMADYVCAITVDGTAVSTVEVVGDVTVDVAFAAKPYYTVTIDGVAQSVKQGEKVVKPDVEPTKEATVEFTFTFDGWYNGETKWDFANDVVTGNLTLVAKYIETKNVYTITFNVTGNDAITLDPVQVEYGTSYDLSKLFDGMDVSDYTYMIQIDGADKVSVKVVGDVTVDVIFTKKSDNNSTSAGCMGSIGGVSVALGMLALGAVALKKKED